MLADRLVHFITLRGGAQYSKLGDTNDLGSLRVGGSEGRGVLDHYHNVIHWTAAPLLVGPFPIALSARVRDAFRSQFQIPD